ncbi:Zn-dependent hydrolase [Tabrizicola sp. TH137]|uniref:MBL fold metallo-hydrolase n=1 Tax=Tabrizicola sp. TH137 TaxID=2067452 RepID=UPI000C7DE681|nr:MBL fold metallo-hydrolase [Tabrizicola sp. TH137]PLL11377.1 Zn-dependent hydrolase [Tabrizicola sp. TH137]
MIARVPTCLPRLTRALSALALLLAALAGPTHAQSTCSAVAQTGAERLWQAQLVDPFAPIAPGKVRLYYTGHGSVAIHSSDRVMAVTDYTGIGFGEVWLPDVVTMNDTMRLQSTDSPHPRIPHVLKGWPDAEGRPADHHLDLGSLMVRNVTTDTRGTAGQGMRPDGNSIFIFEVEGLCIGHLGALQGMPDDSAFAAIGRLDVVMVAVEGPNRPSRAEMLAILDRLQARVVIPVHWLSLEPLMQFLQEMEGPFQIVQTFEPQLDLSLGTLPASPTVIVLFPQLHP